MPLTARPIPGRPLPVRLLAFGLSLCAAPALAAPRVAADVAPIHSIVAAVMAGVGTPDLILPPGASPHGHALRPSEAQAVAQADLVVWVGPALTPWLEHPIESLGGGAAQLELMQAPGVTLLPVRESALFEPHHHDDDEEDADHGHGHDDAAERESPDAHIWLDPANAAAIAAAVAEELARVDPQNVATYRGNAERFGGEIQGLSAEIAATLAPVHGVGFFVFHDAYQYFERAFDLPATGSISLADGEAPTPGRVAEIRARLLDADAVCVFSEPQFEPKLIATLIEDTPVRTGVLDPIGTDFAPGPGLYPATLRGLADALAGCLRG